MTADPFNPTPARRETKDPRKAAYNEALQNLRQNYPEEYADLLKEALEARGLEYKPRLTAEEREEKEKEAAVAKARETVAALVEKFGPEVLEDPEESE